MRTWLLVLVGVALIGAASTATAAPAGSLTLQQLKSAAPASTIVQVGKQTFTLGQLRAAHDAREATFRKAGSVGLGIGGLLKKQTPIVLHERIGVIARGGAATILSPTLVVEPRSQYASTPADMQAFCAAAAASACLYLPPQQQVSGWSDGSIVDFDYLVDQGQCGQEGGTWAARFGGLSSCAFYYPSRVVVHFTPASNYKLSRTASCDQSTWTFQVDVHGAVTIQIVPQHAGYGDFTTGNSAACVVRVSLG
jgi:hypothetical protein